MALTGAEVKAFYVSESGVNALPDGASITVSLTAGSFIRFDVELTDGTNTKRTAMGIPIADFAAFQAQIVTIIENHIKGT